MWYVPSSAADGLSAKTDNVLALIAARLPSLMEAEQKGVETGFINGESCFRNATCICLIFYLGEDVGCPSSSISTMSKSGNESLIHQSRTSST